MLLCIGGDGEGRRMMRDVGGRRGVLRQKN